MIHRSSVRATRISTDPFLLHALCAKAHEDEREKRGKSSDGCTCRHAMLEGMLIIAARPPPPLSLSLSLSGVTRPASVSRRIIKSRYETRRRRVNVG